MALMLLGELRNNEFTAVSILVLLDMALMLRSYASLYRLRGSFNPCFTGYGSDA